MKTLILLLNLLYSLSALEITQTPIVFDEERIALSKAYIQSHYGLNVKNIKITPKIIVLHFTAVDDFNASFERLNPTKLFTDRSDIAAAGALNVSAQFLVHKDGSIHQLMPSDRFARHVIGLNYSSIGIENVARNANALTKEQIKSNISLVKHLKEKHPSIEYLIGHEEYQCFENHRLWLEKDAGYRTEKDDPGFYFLNSVRKEFPSLKKAPCT